MSTPLPSDPIPPDLQRWLDEQADGAELARAWQLAGHATPPVGDEAVETAWRQTQTRLANAEQLRQPESLRQYPRTRAADRSADRPARPLQRMLGVAVGLTLVGLLVLVAVAQWGRQSVTVYADRAAMALTLPDGSPVTLAPGSSLTYHRAFRERTVDLVGQAHFEVTPGRRFTVETINAEITVLGTAFDIRAWPVPQAPEVAETEVVVYEGRVGLRVRGASGGVELVAGQRSRLVGAAAQPEAPVTADLESADAWRTAAFAALDAPLASVVAQVERQFDARVRLGPAVDPARRVTVVLTTADSAETVLADLAAYLGYRLDRRQDGTFELR